jgi:hypothetical protein
MMDVRVATGDVESAKLLVVDLVCLFGGECVSLQADGEVQLHLRGEINGALVQTLKAVERWLEQTQTASADVSVDRHAYTVGMTATDQTSARRQPEVSEAMPTPGTAPVDERKRVATVAAKREMVRALNEQIRILAHPSGDISADQAQADFVCECPHETCFAVVAMTVTEWKAATTEPDYYITHPQHVAAGDQAVMASDRYAVARSASPEESAHCQAQAETFDRP